MRFDIPDDPIVACMERTGYPPWHRDEWEDEEYEEEDEDDGTGDHNDREP
jgi:hypothetical protein